MCLLPVATIAGSLTTDTDFSAGIVGPMVCPAPSKVQIQHSQTSMLDSQGVEQPAMGSSMVCVDQAGKVVSEPAPLPTFIWNGLTFLAALVVAAVLAVLLAAPLGGVVAWLVSKIKPAPTL